MRCVETGVMVYPREDARLSRFILARMTFSSAASSLTRGTSSQSGVCEYVRNFCISHSIEDVRLGLLEWLIGFYIIALENNTDNYYNLRPMMDATDLTKFAANLGFTLADVKKTLEAAAARETTGRARAEPRPVTVAASRGLLEWPSAKWKGSLEELSRKQGAIVEFLRRVWKPFIDEHNVLVTREILKDQDPAAANALRGYLQYKPFPGDIRIFTTEELREHLTRQPVTATLLPR